MSTATTPYNRALTCAGKVPYRTRFLALWGVAFHYPHECERCLSGRAFEVYACGDHWHAGHGLRERSP